jgi:hypothetical protein
MESSGCRPGSQMSTKPKMCSVLAIVLLGASPCWAMSTITVPANKDGTPRFTDSDKTQSPFTGSIQTTIGVGSNSAGFGGSSSFGTRPFGSQDTPASRIAPLLPERGFSSSAPAGSSPTDPTFGPQGLYAPAIHDGLH